MTSTQITRRMASFEEIKARAGVSDQESNSITKEEKRALAEAGTPFDITDMQQMDGENGPYWMFTVSLNDEERVFFMGENRGNTELFAAMHEAVCDGEGQIIPNMRLTYVPERIDKSGKRRYAFYKLEMAEFVAIQEKAGKRKKVQAALEGTQALLSDEDALSI